MKTRVALVLMIFVISVLVLLFLSLYLLIKKHSMGRELKFITNLKIFLGLEKEKNSIADYFNSADKILKYFLKNSSNYKYELPWYLSFGMARAGKTSFFSNVSLETPIRLNYTDTTYINHYFFNEGIVLDLKSDLIFNDSSHDFCWTGLLNQIKTVRPMKNIDGIIYFVSLKDLLSTDANIMLNNKKNIESLYQKLWQLQNKFEMKIPVYLIFTHLDEIQGFSDFLEVFSNYKEDMFGWSNPFSLDSKFSSEWLEEMKKKLDEELKSLLSEVMVNFPSEISFNIMNFINNFQLIYPKICEYLTLTFQNNKYTSGLYFRGAYFTALDQTKTNQEKIPVLNGEDSEIEGGFEIEKSKIFFAKDLLLNKIFAEKEIGKEDVDKKQVEHELKLLKTGFTAFSLVASAYSVKVYKDLVYMNEQIYPRALKVVEVLDEYDKDKNYVHRVDFLDELKVVLQYLGDLSSYDLFFHGIPSSFFSSVNRCKQNMVLVATKKLVLTTLFNDIENKFIKISKKKLYDTIPENRPFVNPLNSNEFALLKKLVAEVSEVEKYEQKFVAFKESNSITSLSWLLENILNIKMPEAFERSIMFSFKIDFSELDTTRFYGYKKNIKKQFRLISNKFVVNCFSKDNISQYFMELERLLFLIESGDQGMSYDNLKSIQKLIADLITLFYESEFDWLKHRSFGSQEFEIVLRQIEGSTILGGEDAVNEIMTRTTTSFNGFKNTLGCYQIPLIGSPFYTTDGLKIQLSQSVLDFQGILNDVFSESFMEKVAKMNFPLLATSQALYWDSKVIKDLVVIINEYKEFEEKFKAASSSKMEVIIKNIAKKNLKKVIEFYLIKAHKVLSLDVKHSHLLDIAENVKITNEEIQKIMEQAGKIDSNLWRDIKDLQKESLLNILTYIDRALQIENLYDIKEDMFLLDAKNKKLFFNFNISDYLLIQKKQIEFFSVNLAKSIVESLEKINFIDNILLDDLVVKWKDIEKNLEDYKSNPANSKLYAFEELAMKVQTTSLRDIFQKDLNKVESNLNKDSFFETKVFFLSQRINKVVDSSISKILVEQYDESMYFYKQNAYAFPFNLKGVLLGISGFNRMQELIKKQEDIVTLVKIVKPNYDSPVFRFIENLEKISKMISFLISNDKCLCLVFNNYKPIGDLYEKNIHLLVECSAKVNGQKALNLYKKGTIDIYDLVEFKVSLAKNCGKKIVKNNLNYKIKGNDAILNFDKKELMKFLMENIIEINHASFIRFTIDIEDDKGIKDKVVVMIPVELTLDGEKYTMPDKTFTKISEEQEQ
ncbi:type VI secretion protein IcmF/TssM N-terminal domain-containing protein [Alphaproteobacteria bacterium endosymbiont of Tiliacea citrago]|uniref:type VI secretion protein IcmF/TssM N-terminal domain-containing protein n=1 Tax=Alphaproteobacteria bacterium endosymbiont of Tiliacea citrago TaxID=3077944 RepID=UPI00313B2B66